MLETFKQSFHSAQLLGLIDLELAKDDHALFKVALWVFEVDLLHFLAVHFFSHFDVGAKVVHLVDFELEVFVGMERWMHNSL